MRRFTLDGTADGTDQLPGIGSAKVWHRAGQLENKQNVFDDFIAVSEFLITQGITMETGLVVQGESNGGLVVDAVVNQRPDLYAAALPGRKLSDRFGASVSALRVQ
ncbi:prolyl oligopeptidase family serine peptidase [Halomonas sp. AOP12-C2-37]|uniref:prolyl oligopeptidase family serine peptidase n=1 Tax=unclassified Halomonas TaxID=2609666 RepID=UPI004034562A